MRKAEAKSGRHARIARSYRARDGAATAAWVGGILLLVAPVAETASTPPLAEEVAAREVLDAAAAAIFAASAPESLRALRAEGVIERGDRVVGRVETLAVRTPPALRETTEMDGVRQVVTVVGEDAWIEDANGAVRPASGDELVACRLAHALLFHEWLDGDLPGFDVRVDVTDPGAPVLRLTPRAGGPERRIGFARDEEGLLLPRRFERSEVGAPSVTTFEDWRLEDGIRFPRVSRSGTGDPRFDIVGRTTSLRLGDLPPGESIEPPVARAPRDARVTDAARARDIPLERVGGLFLVRAEADGDAGLGFLLDTGAGATVVAAEWASGRGLPSRGVVEARGAGGSEAAAYVDVPVLRLPGVVLAGQTLVSIPLGGLAAALGTRVDGILGWDFLSRFAVEIDEPRGRLAVFAPGEYVPRPDAVRLALRIEANVPRVDGVLDGRHRGSFLLDTGNATPLLLHTTFAAAHGYAGRARESSRTLSGIGGHAAMREVTIATLALGPVVFDDVAAVLAPEGGGVMALEDSIGNLGAALFAGRVLALDYGAGAAWLSRGAARASADSASAR